MSVLTCIKETTTKLFNSSPASQKISCEKLSFSENKVRLSTEKKLLTVRVGLFSLREKAPTKNKDSYETIKTKLKHFYNSQIVEFLVFSAYENPLLLREVHMIDGTMLIMFLDRRNSENS